MEQTPRAGGPGTEAEARLLEALTVAAVVTDSGSRVVLANRAARGLAGAAIVEPTGRLLPEALVEEPQREAVAGALRGVMRGERWEGELVVGRGASARPASVTLSPLRDGERVTGALLVADASPSSGQAQRLAERLARLARVTSELLFAVDVPTVTKIVTEHVAEAVGADVASLSMIVDQETLRLVGVRGLSTETVTRWQTYRAAGTPAGDSVISRRILVLSGRDAIRSRYPDLEIAHDGERTIVCLPLLVSGRGTGVVTLSFPGRRTFDGPQLEFFRVMADTCAQALDRVSALEEAADQAFKLQLLADATAELSRSLDYESTLRHVAWLAVPSFADWCVIAVAMDGELRTLAVAHVDPDKLALARTLQERYPPDPAASRGSYHVFRTGESELTPEITDEMLDGLIDDEEQLAMVRELNLRSAMSVPLKVNDRVLGVLTWVAGDHGRRFSARDLSFGEDLARRAAVAIDNARLHSEVREMAMRLQRAVLPSTLPHIEGWEMTAHYSPAGHLDAGGDFYDVIPLGGGRVALFIGDVMGRGVHAAAAMAQMRSATRAVVAMNPDPGVVLSMLDRIFEQYGVDQLVTMLYAVVDPERNEVTVANAGHPPPVVVHADGTTGLLPVPQDVLLGAGRAERSRTVSSFRPGDTLLAFTDGLIERRDEDIDVGQRRLLEACRQLDGTDLGTALHTLIQAVSDPTREDDVAALVLRRTALEHGLHHSPDEAEPALPSVG